MTAAAESIGPESSSETKLGRALIVDDDVALCTTMARYMTRLGYEVVTAYTGTDGRQCLQQHDDFDVALFDLHLPDDSGLDLLLAFKEKLPQSEAIVLTGSGSLEVALHAIRNGAFDFIPKPFVLEQLDRSLARMVERRKLQDVTALYRASHAIFATGEIEKLPEVIVGVSLRVMAADSVSLLLPGVGDQLYLAHSYGLDPEVAKTVRVKIGQGVAGRVAESRTPVVIQGDARQQAGFSGITNANGAKSSIVYPLVSDRRLVGMLTFNRLNAARPFRQHDLEKAGVLAAQVLLSLETTRLVRQNLTNEKLAAVGQLAAGITHEINTPIQFIGDSVTFLKRAIGNLAILLGKCKELVDAAGAIPDLAPLADQIKTMETELDVAYDLEEMPLAVARTLEGVGRVAEIVRAMKAFAHPDRKDKAQANINDVLANALTVARNECKYVAETVTDLGDVPSVTCHAGEIGQVFLVLIVNAAHAIADTKTVQDGGRGIITMKTEVDGAHHVLISIADTGSGIPIEIRERIFEPFFTTKEVGKGTGLGLPIARAIVAEKHGGSLTFSSEIGRGTTFFVRLPVEANDEVAEAG
jgi:signal transduction histidine kinase/ActR/RegA family two-component response regulator